VSSNYPPDFDFDSDSGAHEECLSIDEGPKIFAHGLRAMRERIAREIAAINVPGLSKKAADTIRQMWKPEWGPDPGTPKVIADEWDDYL